MRRLAGDDLVTADASKFTGRFSLAAGQSAHFVCSADPFDLGTAVEQAQKQANGGLSGDYKKVAELVAAGVLWSGGDLPDAVGWVCLEQSGPWGKKAWTSSHLDAGLGRQLLGRAHLRRRTRQHQGQRRDHQRPHRAIWNLGYGFQMVAGWPVVGVGHGPVLGEYQRARVRQLPDRHDRRSTARP